MLNRTTQGARRVGAGRSGTGTGSRAEGRCRRRGGRWTGKKPWWEQVEPYNISDNLSDTVGLPAVGSIKRSGWLAGGSGMKKRKSRACGEPQEIIDRRFDGRCSSSPLHLNDLQLFYIIPARVQTTTNDRRESWLSPCSPLHSPTRLSSSIPLPPCLLLDLTLCLASNPPLRPV